MRLHAHVLAIGATFAIGAAAGCASATTAGPPRLLSVDRPSDPHRVFPAGRASTADSITCVPVGAPDSTIAYQRAATRSRYLGAVSLRLPSEYTQIRHDDRPAGAEDVGGLIVASWYALASGQPRRRPLGVGAWVVPESGLPTVGAPPGTQQITFAECATGDRPVRGARVAVFTLATGADTTAYLAAVWPVGNGRRLQILASAPSVAQLNPVRRALLDAVTEPPANWRP